MPVEPFENNQSPPSGKKRVRPGDDAVVFDVVEPPGNPILPGSADADIVTNHVQGDVDGIDAGLLSGTAMLSNSDSGISESAVLPKLSSEPFAGNDELQENYKRELKVLENQITVVNRDIAAIDQQIGESKRVLADERARLSIERAAIQNGFSSDSLDLEAEMKRIAESEAFAYAALKSEYDTKSLLLNARENLMDLIGQKRRNLTDYIAAKLTRTEAQLLHHENRPIEGLSVSGESFEKLFTRKDRVTHLIIPEKDEYMTVALDFFSGSGLEDRKQGDVVIFMRQGCIDQIQFIRDTAIYGTEAANIIGQPGTGKSLLTYLYVSTLANEWTVIWLHHGFFLETARVNLHCVIMHNSTTLVESVSVDQIPNLLEWCVEKFPGRHILVFDGFTEAVALTPLMGEVVEWWNKNPLSRRFVRVCSTGIMQKSKDEKSTLKDVKTFTQVAWTLDEYRRAIKNPTFAASVERFLDADLHAGASSLSDSVAAKYFFAGGCARAMFERSTVDVIAKIKKSVETVADISKLNSLCTGTLSNGASHNLISLVDPGGPPQIISSYAAFRLATRCGPEYFLSLANHSMFVSNPLINGFFFELFFFSHAAIGKIRLHENNGSTQEWFFLIEAMIFNPNFPLLIDCPRNKWLIPNVWNQAGYDGVILIRNENDEKNVIRFVQITRATTHDLKLSYFADLVNCLSSRGIFISDVVEIFFIVPRRVLSAFKISKIESPSALRMYNWPTSAAAIRKKVPVVGLDFEIGLFN